jgi:hypothetical protein
MTLPPNYRMTLPPNYRMTLPPNYRMTLPPNYSWSPVGQPVCVAYEAPQGRRINVLGAYFSHGPLAGRFVSELYATLPIM